jgi:hypothetical protein
MTDIRSTPGAATAAIGCGDAASASKAIDRLAARGCVIKLALDGDGLDPRWSGRRRQARARHLKVAVHALSDRSAAIAAAPAPTSSPARRPAALR